jgi:hypothetical protein
MPASPAEGLLLCAAFLHSDHASWPGYGVSLQVLCQSPEQEPLIRMAAVQSPIHPSVAHVRSRPLSSVYSGNLVSAEMSVAS